jgi:hypothetical protein
VTAPVPVLVPPDDETAMSLPNEAILAEAIERTLAQVDITWPNLQTMFRLSGSFTEGAVRLLTQQVSTALFDRLESEVVGTSVLVAILDEATGCSWIDSSQLDRWKGQLKVYCLSMEDEWFDQIDAFMPIAKWVSGNRGLFSDEEYAAFKKLAGKIVDNESHIDPHPNMESFWVEMKDGVVELQRLLSQDFRRELERIEEKIEGADKPQTFSQPFSRRDAMSHTTSIDSLFDALLQ